MHGPSTVVTFGGVNDRAVIAPPRAGATMAERRSHEPAKRAKIAESSHGRQTRDGELGPVGLMEQGTRTKPEEVLVSEFADAMKNVVHEPQHGIYWPPARASSGCPWLPVYNGVTTPVPCFGVVAGMLRLADVPGSRLDYAVALEVGSMLEGELHDEGSGIIGFVRFARVMDMYETIVPPAHRGKGVAKRLVRAAFAVAHVYGFRVRPSCSYISETFLAARPAEEYDARRGRQCDELLLFTCCPEGKALEGRRRQLMRLPVAELKSRCEQAGVKIDARRGAKYFMVERLLAHEFGPAAARRSSTLAAQEKDRRAVKDEVKDT